MHSFAFLLVYVWYKLFERQNISFSSCGRLLHFKSKIYVCLLWALPKCIYEKLIRETIYIVLTLATISSAFNLVHSEVWFLTLSMPAAVSASLWIICSALYNHHMSTTTEKAIAYRTLCTVRIVQVLYARWRVGHNQQMILLWHGNFYRGCAATILKLFRPRWNLSDFPTDI